MEGKWGRGSGTLLLPVESKHGVRTGERKDEVVLESAVKQGVCVLCWALVVIAWQQGSRIHTRCFAFLKFNSLHLLLPYELSSDLSNAGSRFLIRVSNRK